MPRSTSPAAHSDVDIMAVAEGLVALAGTDAAADQLRRIYGDVRATRALRAVGGQPTSAALVRPESVPSRARTVSVDVLSTTVDDLTVEHRATPQPAARPATAESGAILRRSHPRTRLPARAGRRDGGRIRFL